MDCSLRDCVLEHFRNHYYVGRYIRGYPPEVSFSVSVSTDSGRIPSFLNILWELSEEVNCQIGCFHVNQSDHSLSAVFSEPFECLIRSGSKFSLETGESLQLLQQSNSMCIKIVWITNQNKETVLTSVTNLCLSNGFPYQILENKMYLWPQQTRTRKKGS